MTKQCIPNKCQHSASPCGIFLCPMARRYRKRQLMMDRFMRKRQLMMDTFMRKRQLMMETSMRKRQHVMDLVMRKVTQQCCTMRWYCWGEGSPILQNWYWLQLVR